MSKSKNIRKTWTDYEQRYLQDNLGSVPVKYIAQCLGRSESSVFAQATKQRNEQYIDRREEITRKQEKEIIRKGREWEERMINGNLYKPEDLTGEELKIYNERYNIEK